MKAAAIERYLINFRLQKIRPGSGDRGRVMQNSKSQMNLLMLETFAQAPFSGASRDPGPIMSQGSPDQHQRPFQQATGRSYHWSPAMFRSACVLSNRTPAQNIVASSQSQFCSGSGSAPVEN
jgi:hypothetical protein